MRYSVIDLESFDLVREGIVPLPKKALLSWIGFSRDGVSPRFFSSIPILSSHPPLARTFLYVLE